MTRRRAGTKRTHGDPAGSEALPAKLSVREEPLSAVDTLLNQRMCDLSRRGYLDLPPEDYERAKLWMGENGYAVFEIDFKLENPWSLLHKQITGVSPPDGEDCRTQIAQVLERHSNDKIALFVRNPHATTKTHDLGAARALNTYCTMWEDKHLVMVTSIPDLRGLCDYGGVCSPFSNIFLRTALDPETSMAQWMPRAILNPYSRGPAKGNRFHGRSRELGELQRPGSNPIAVTGFYKAGKTSLLVEYMRRAGEINPSADACSVKLMSAEGVGSSADLYHQILRTLGITRRVASSRFIDTLKDLDARLSDASRRCTLLLDEFTAITQLTDKKRVLSVFHALIDQLEAIRLVYTIHPHAIISIRSETSRFLSSITTLPIGPLEAQHIDSMVDQAIECGKRVDPEARQHIHELSGGHAFLAEELMRLAFDAAENEINPCVLDAIMRNGGLVEVTDTIAQVWQRMTPVERDLLRVVLDNSNPTKRDLLTAPLFESPGAEPGLILTALEFLTAKTGVLELSGDTYRIRGELVRAKLDDTRTIERARESRAAIQS